MASINSISQDCFSYRLIGALNAREISHLRGVSKQLNARIEIIAKRKILIFQVEWKKHKEGNQPKFLISQLNLLDFFPEKTVLNLFLDINIKDSIIFDELVQLNSELNQKASERIERLKELTIKKQQLDEKGVLPKGAADFVNSVQQFIKTTEQNKVISQIQFLFCLFYATTPVKNAVRSLHAFFTTGDKSLSKYFRAIFMRHQEITMDELNPQFAVQIVNAAKQSPGLKKITFTVLANIDKTTFEALKKSDKEIVALKKARFERFSERMEAKHVVGGLLAFAPKWLLTAALINYCLVCCGVGIITAGWIASIAAIPLAITGIILILYGLHRVQSYLEARPWHYLP